MNHIVDGSQTRIRRRAASVPQVTLTMLGARQFKIEPQDRHCLVNLHPLHKYRVNCAKLETIHGMFSTNTVPTSYHERRSR